MNIGHAADATDLPTKTIRYYEDIGLVTPARGANGYRAYREQDLHKLRFLQRSRSLGFTIAQCRQLLSLYDDRHRASSDVKAIATTHLSEIDTKIRELQSLRGALEILVKTCRGDNRPGCPILDDLAAPAKEKL